MNKVDVQNIVDNIYPLIQSDYGVSKFNGQPPKVELYKSLVGRLSGVDENIGDPASGQYDRDDNTIYVYYPHVTGIRDLVGTLLHEYRHYLQSPSWMKRYYDMGYEYDTHPYEIEATNEESNWFKFISYE